MHNIIKIFRETGEISVRKEQGWRPLLDVRGLRALRHCITHRHDAKEEGDLPVCYLRSVQKPAYLMLFGCINSYGMDSLHVLEGTMNAETYIKVLKQHMLPSRRCLFQGRPCVFQQDNAKPHTVAITTTWLRSRRVLGLKWPACSPDLSPIENIWCMIKWKIRQKQPRTLQQMETYFRQEWDQIPTAKLQKLITSMPRCLQTVLKRRGDATPW